MEQDERHVRDEVITDQPACGELPERDEQEETTAESVSLADFPNVPARDVGIDYTDDVDPPPNTGAHGWGGVGLPG